MTGNGMNDSIHVNSVGESADSNGAERTLRVGVLFGGRSSEHEVSLASAANVMDALKQAGYEVTPIGITQEGRWLTVGDPHHYLTAKKETGVYLNGSAPTPEEQKDVWGLLPKPGKQGAPLPPVDVIFPVLHGPFGEDGTVQGLLEMANLPYVGCGVLSSAVAMDKEVARRLFGAAGLPQVAYCLVMRSKWQRERDVILDDLETALSYPMFVKPANMGSSVGVTKAKHREGLVAAIENAARFDRKILVEQAVPNAREIEVSVLGNDDPIASIPGEIVPGAEFYDYAAKYLDDNSDLLIPANLDAETMSALQKMAVEAFKVVEGSGLARVDFLLDGESGALYLNEINTLPGFTRISMYPKLWEASGIPYPALVDRLVKLSLERYIDRQQNSTAHE